MQKLPLGKQNFKDIIEGNFIYVDKTNWILQLLEKDVPYFLSRPRRFGKTLTVSTLFHLFKGRQELFKDTYIYDKWDFTERPVIRLDMSEVNSSEGNKVLKNELLRVIKIQAKINNVDLSESLYSAAFQELIGELDNPAVLIDEYDKPILGNIHKPGYVDQIRETLKEFYGAIKNKESDLSFIFITGISKFSKMSIFSELNNLTDLTLRKGYTDMLGLSDTEIAENFREYIEQVKKEQNMSEDEFWTRLKDYYNGFSFDGEHFLYNPYSILNFFDTGEFRNYWFESGTPSHLIELIKNQMLKSTDFSQKRVSLDFTSRRPIESTTPESFLFQAGYLTIKEKRQRVYLLDYPNTEVRSSFNSLFLDSIYEIKDAPALIDDIWIGLENNDFAMVFEQFKLAFSKIPYPLYSKKQKENIYHIVLLTLLWATGIKTTAEDMSNLGRSDIVIEFGDDIYILELKRDSAAKALQQIKDKEYYKKFTGQDKNIHLVGIEIDDEQRNFGGYKLEKFTG
jgi:hypothetical protein